MELPDSRPLIVALAGPNGAGKSTFHEAFLVPAGLRFINADELSRELGVPVYEAAQMADNLRRLLVSQRESFIFETVFSDPVGDKVKILQEAAASGYTVILCYIGIDSADTSGQRVAMRVAQQGHDVPADKIAARYARTLANLTRALRGLPVVLIYDNSDLAHAFRLVAEYRAGKPVRIVRPLPGWLQLPD